MVVSQAGVVVVVITVVGEVAVIFVVEVLIGVVGEVVATVVVSLVQLVVVFLRCRGFICCIIFFESCCVGTKSCSSLSVLCITL